MKAILISIALIAPTLAADFDAEAFGQSLNGWKKDRTAVYEFTDASYRTHMPTITATPGGGMFVTTQVDLLAFGDSGAISHIDMTFSSGGTLLGARLRTTVGRKTIDTGLVRRPEEPVAAPAAEGQPAAKPMPFNGSDELLIELFNRYDTEMRKISEGKDAEKRDLFSRMAGSRNAKTANLSAGLRHNCNLMIQHVSGRGSR